MEKFEVFLGEVKTVVFGYLKFVIWESGNWEYGVNDESDNFSAAKKVRKD